MTIAVRHYYVKPDLGTFGSRENCEKRSAFQSNDFALNTRTAGVLTTLSAVNASVDVGTLFDVVYSATDAAGNKASSSRLVLVVDTKAPSLQLRGAPGMTVPFGTAYTEPGVFATDESEGELMACVATAVQPKIDVHWPRTSTITYTISDRYGNTENVVREVAVAPFQLPPPGHTLMLTLGVSLSEAPDACAMQEWLEAVLVDLQAHIFLVGRHSGMDVLNLAPNNTLAEQGAWVPPCTNVRQRRRSPPSSNGSGANVTVLEVVARSKSTLAWLRASVLLSALQLAPGQPIAAMDNIILLQVASDVPSDTATDGTATVAGAIGAAIAIISILATYTAYRRRRGKPARIGTGGVFSNGDYEGTGAQMEGTQVGKMYTNPSFGDWAAKDVTESTSAASMTATSDADAEYVRDDALVQFGPLLGHFHSGSVHQALFVSPTTKRPKACLALIVSNAESSVQSIEAELRVHALLADVPSPHVLTMIWHGSLHNSPLLLFESVSAGNLLSFLRTLRADWQADAASVNSERLQDEVLQLAVGVALAGQALAQAGVVHNNICARAFVVSRRGPSVDAKIGDFAFATTQHGDPVGPKDSSVLSPRWRAPDVLAGGAGTPAADVWSLGVTLWEVFTLGATPYPQAKAADIRAYLQTRNRLPKPRICTAVLYETVLVQAWRTSPTDRATAAMIAERLCNPGQLLIEPSANQFDALPFDSEDSALQPVCGPRGRLTWSKGLAAPAQVAASPFDAQTSHESEPGVLSAELDDHGMVHNPVYQSPGAPDNLSSSWLTSNPAYAMSNDRGMMINNLVYASSAQDNVSGSSVASSAADGMIYSTPLEKDLFSSC
jgi:serine/threonine protein kinase